MFFQNNEIPIVTIPVTISNKNGKPCVELRKVLTDVSLLKYILTCAYREQPMIIMPNFRDKLHSLNTMQKNGLVEYSYEDDQWHWLV